MIFPLFACDLINYNRRIGFLGVLLTQGTGMLSCLFGLCRPSRALYILAAARVEGRAGEVVGLMCTHKTVLEFFLKILILGAGRLKRGLGFCGTQRLWGTLRECVGWTGVW